MDRVVYIFYYSVSCSVFMSRGATIAKSFTDSTGSDGCENPYVSVGNKCLFFGDSLSLDQGGAQQICSALNGKLLSIDTAEDFKVLVDFMYKRSDPLMPYWLDGSDSVAETFWLYASGDQVPMGTPFWGTWTTVQDGEAQFPDTDSSRNCLGLGGPDEFLYFRDANCDDEKRPLCERLKMPLLNSEDTSAFNVSQEMIESSDDHSNITGLSEGSNVPHVRMGPVSDDLQNIPGLSECYHHYKNDSGEIRFPLTGDMYENEQTCIWIIETSGPLIEISLNQFSTEATYDVLTIRDGDNSGSPLVGSFSGDIDSSNAFRTATSKSYLSFASDASNVRSGFVISWNTATVEGDSDCTCGSVNGEKKIVGGEEVGHSLKYPWHVGLFTPKFSRFYFCGGTLISDNYVLTAAHCVINYSGTLKVRIGEHDRESTTDDIEGVTEAVLVTKIYIHPRYSKETNNNDFALLKLQKSIILTDGFGIRPICLPSIGSNKTYTGELGLSLGWGVLAYGNRAVPDTLRQVEMTILSPECSGLARVTPAMICAYTDGKDTCQGDSGGSLAVLENATNETSEHYVFVGVVSWGKGCDFGIPGVYSRVTEALDWIQLHTVSCERRGAA